MGFTVIVTFLGFGWMPWYFQAYTNEPKELPKTCRIMAFFFAVTAAIFYLAGDSPNIYQSPTLRRGIKTILAPGLLVCALPWWYASTWSVAT